MIFEKLEDFLQNKTLYYDKIDYDVIALSWNILSEHIVLPYIIHIVGTNGKGSTGRYLASLLHQQEKTVLHYSSPHILKFNERIWIDGADVSDVLLEETHQILITLLPQEILKKLTYFEYTTLLALYLSKGKEYLVLEAGLGGEFDATNVVRNDLSIFTTIGLDHQSFLGDTVREIAATKMRSCDTRFILSHQIFTDVTTVKKEILFEKEEILLQEFTLPKEAQLLPYYLQNNLQVVLSVLSYLGLQASKYSIPKLFGRFERVRSNIIVDVGHNPLAAQAIAKELSKEEKKFILIYNSFKDKDYKNVLEILQPYISEVQIIPCEDTRIVEKIVLEEVLLDLSINRRDFDILAMEEKQHYLVFGSFLVVENFLKEVAKYEKR